MICLLLAQTSPSPPQRWSRLSMRLIAAAAAVQRKSFKYPEYWKKSSNNECNGQTWHYIGLIKSGSNIPPRLGVNSSIFPLAGAHGHHFTVVPCLAPELVEQYDTGASSKFFPLIPILSADH